MHARSLLDFLPDAAQSSHGGEKARLEHARNVIERLAELEAQLAAMLIESEAHQASVEQTPPLREEISTILKRRGIFPQPKQPEPQAPFAPRMSIEPPALAPEAAFDVADDHATDGEFLKFIQAVRLLGRAADRFAERSSTDRARAHETPPPVSPSVQPQPAPLPQASRSVSETAPEEATTYSELEAQLARLRRELEGIAARRISY